jgi:hypothetical protein
VRNFLPVFILSLLIPSTVSDRFIVCPFQFLPVAKHHGFRAVSLLYILRLVRKDQPRTLRCSGNGIFVLPRSCFMKKVYLEMCSESWKL